MAKSKRYLKTRGQSGNWFYQRAIPENIADLIEQSGTITVSLNTTDFAVARARRDVMALEHDRFWAALVAGERAQGVREQHAANIELARSVNVKRAEMKGVTPQTPVEMASFTRAFFDTFQATTGTSPWDYIDDPDEFDRIASIPAVQAVGIAATSGTPSLAQSVTEAFEVYISEIAVDDVQGMNAEQLRAWTKTKRRAVNNFCKVVSDKPMLEITRDDGKDFYKFWRNRITPPANSKDKPLSSSAGNRDLGNMRILFEQYAQWMDNDDLPNPFRNLRFKRKEGKRKAFTTEWLKTKFLTGTALSGLNDEARSIFLLCLCLGARPSEICNLAPEQIHLNVNLPFIEIAAISEGEHQRAIKSKQSCRSLPLIGLALETMRKHPDGFERYRGKANSLSAVVMKHLKEKGLLESSDQSFYSLRHSVEDRLKDAGVGDDMRRILIGHRIDRPDYGEGFTLERKSEALAKIELSYDPTIL